jgi:hypothetical protein
MEIKEQLVNNIKDWIKIDNELIQLKAEIKDKTNKKKGLTENLVTIMKSNNIDCFDIKDGSLVYKKNKIKKPLSSKTLLSALKNCQKIESTDAEEIVKHIMDSREEQIKEIIKRKVN